MLLSCCHIPGRYQVHHVRGRTYDITGSTSRTASEQSLASALPIPIYFCHYYCTININSVDVALEPRRLFEYSEPVRLVKQLTSRGTASDGRRLAINTRSAVIQNSTAAGIKKKYHRSKIKLVYTTYFPNGTPRFFPYNISPFFPYGIPAFFRCYCFSIFPVFSNRFCLNSFLVFRTVTSVLIIA